MFVVLRVLARPWRTLRKVRTLAITFVTGRRRMIELQAATIAEVRELHRSSLLAAIRVIEEQREARDALARDCARLERRLEEVERRLAAAGAPPAPDRPVGG